MPKLIFHDGISIKTGAYLTAQVMHDNGELVDGTLYVDYRFTVNPEVFCTNWTAISICYKEIENAVYAAGENGEIVRISDSGNSEEFIAPTENGPAVEGPIREIRAIGDDLYAVGMGRQVYRRANNRRWQHVDAGILDVSERVTAGLTSITGNDQGFLVAVGYDGEIWEFHETWMQVDSPTNVLLTRVISFNGNYYAAGLVGTVLCRDREGWRIIDTGDFEQDIWDLETFGGVLYLGTTQGLFWMSASEQIKLVDPATFTRQIRCASLSAGRDRLWCFGGDIVSSTSDGVIWREEVVI